MRAEMRHVIAVLVLIGMITALLFIVSKDVNVLTEDASISEANLGGETARLPRKARLDAPFIRQKPELPNGCEVTSLAMLLNDAGLKADKMKLAAEIKKVPFESDGFMGNPNEGFVGNMYHGDRSQPGYAVYHGPVADLASGYLGDRLIDFSGGEWSDVEKSLALDRPVWVITSIDFKPVPQAEWRDWRTRSGELRITFKEHSVLVTGYDEKYVYFNDPLASHPDSKAEKSAFVRAWEQFGNQAISYEN